MKEKVEGYEKKRAQQSNERRGSSVMNASKTRKLKETPWEYSNA